MPPQTNPLIQASDITYLGSFAVPDPTGCNFQQSCTFMYGGMALAMHPSGTSIYVGSHIYEYKIGRVSIPVIGGTATVIQAPTFVPGTLTSGTLNQINGAIVWNNRLIVQKGSHYDTTIGSTNGTHIAGDLNIANFGPFYQMANAPYQAHNNGYMGIIPNEWRTLLGGPAFSGNSTMSIVSTNSVGPSFYVFNPDDVGVVNPIPSIKLADFDLTNQFMGVDVNSGTVGNDWISRADQANAGMFFPSGTRSVLFVYKHGYGVHKYKQPGDPCDPNMGGEEAYPYRRQVTAIDANELLAVKNGTKQPYQVQAYAFWTLPGPVSTCAGFQYGGLAYDDTTGRLYIAEDWSSNPRIQVFQVTGGSGTGQPPTAPTGLRVL